MHISRLVYVSTANPGLLQTDLDAILETARARNAAEGITGLLVFNGFNFMQLLEGPPGSVQRVFNAICRDQRHSGVVRVLSGEADRRVFADWAMAFARTGSGHGEGVFASTAEALKGFLPEDLSPELHMLFVSFNTMSAFDANPAARDGSELAP